MDGVERKAYIIELLKCVDEPVTGAELAQQCSVSRQIIVGDISVLRAKGVPIVSTPQGYQLVADTRLPEGLQCRIVCCHGPELVEKELEAIVDNGGMVRNVGVEHHVYGFLEVELLLRSRRDIRRYVEQMAETKATLLSSISHGVHTHLIETKSEDDFQAILAELKKMHILLSE